VIVDGVSEPLLAAQVSLRGLDADVTKQELDLLKLNTCLVTQTRTSSPQIMRGNAVESRPLLEHPAFTTPGSLSD